MIMNLLGFGGFALIVPAIGLEVVSNAPLGGDVGQPSVQPLGRINNITMLWLAEHPGSAQRIRSTVCGHWPSDLKQKLSLFDGINAEKLDWDTSKVMETPRALATFGDAIQARRAEALEMHTGIPSRRAATVALAVGHMSIWKQVAEGPEDGWTFVIEDDAVLKQGHQTLHALENIQIPLDDKYPTFVMLDPRDQTLTPGKCGRCRTGCGFSAYAINKKAAVHLLRHTGLKYVVDWSVHRIPDSGWRIVCPMESTPFELGKTHKMSLKAKFLDSDVAPVAEEHLSEVDVRVCAQKD